MLGPLRDQAATAVLEAFEQGYIPSWAAVGAGQQAVWPNVTVLIPNPDVRHQMELHVLSQTPLPQGLHLKRVHYCRACYYIVQGREVQHSNGSY